MASFATYFVHDCLQLVKKRQVYLTELTTILCSIIQFFCKNKLRLFRICRNFDFYTYGNDFRGGGVAPIFTTFSIFTKLN